ncbi:MAG: transcription elongation factor GreA [Deltaproteobacteria bacterium]|nr:transcription elongation factor GreA [Deltaproteobacteria bacterium]
MQKEPITIDGHQRLLQEIKRLKSVERPAVVKSIEEARAHGDLKENAEYHAAKEKQGLLEAKIRDLEHLLAHAQILDPKSIKIDKVAFGATVTLRNLDTDEEKKYQLVGKFETDPKNGKIPISAPIARALLGKKAGEEVSVHVPKGVQQFEILEVDYI